MKKRNYLMVMTIICIALLSSQSTMAKKVVYLGHQYNGEVNKEKAPEGEGEIDIDGLVIKGVFEGNKINSASFTKDWLNYEGEITFDDSNDVILKSGGVLTQYYYESRSIYQPEKYMPKYVYPNDLTERRKSVTQPLAEDMKTNNFKLSILPLNYPHNVSFWLVPSKLNPPKITTVPIKLERFLKWDTRIPDKEKEAIYLYVVDQNELNNISIKGYKDDQGRVWDIIKTPKESYKVTYPDGSYCSSATNGERRLSIGKMEISGDYPDGSYVAYYDNEPIYCKRTYSDGMVFQYFNNADYYKKNYQEIYQKVFAGRVDETVAKRLPQYFDMGNGLMVQYKDRLKDNEIAEFKDSLRLHYYDNYGYYQIFSKKYDFKSMSKQELKKLLDEKFFPYTLKKAVTGKDHWGDEKVLFKYDATTNTFGFCDYETGDEIAKYNKGEIVTKEDQNAKNKKIHEDLDKDYSNNINLLKKKYGAKYVDAAMNGQLLVGMPFDLLLEKDFWQYWDGLTVNTKGHYMAEYSWLVYNYIKAKGIYKAERLKKSSNIYVQSHNFIIWVRNGKITQINK